jgi:hypothetical protein
MPVYRPLGAEKLGANADQKASLDWGPSLAGVAWPNAELRAAYERYFAEMLRVADMLVHAFALALDLAEEAFAPYFDDRSSSLRVIDYPAGATGARAGAHRDYGCEAWGTLGSPTCPLLLATRDEAHLRSRRERGLASARNALTTKNVPRSSDSWAVRTYR